jgi:hypothetical protein
MYAADCHQCTSFSGALATRIADDATMDAMRTHNNIMRMTTRGGLTLG